MKPLSHILMAEDNFNDAEVKPIDNSGILQSKRNIYQNY